jgi:tetratricopeptide (TPR) repeat protein
MGVLAWIPFRTIEDIFRRSGEKAAVGNLSQVWRAMAQFKLEAGGGRLFVAESELVGPDTYVKTLNSVRGEDYAEVFPIRWDLAETLDVTLPNGRVVTRTEVLTVTMPWGQRVSCPELDDLDGRKIDGIHVARLGDGSRFEISYRNGVPDGPFRAFRADDRPWGEANYVRGRIVGTCWLYTEDGQKIDELVISAVRLEWNADRRRETRDLKGAVAEYTRAIDLATPTTASAATEHRLAIARCYYKRGHTRRWLGDLPGAAADFREAAAALPTTDQMINRNDAAAWLCLVQCEQGQSEAARAELRAATTPGGSDGDALLLRFLLGELTEAQLNAGIAALRGHAPAPRSLELKAALYASALRHLVGDPSGAFELLRRARRSTPDRLLYQVADQALSRLAKLQALSRPGKQR